MSKQNVMLDSLLYVLRNLETDISDSLNKINEEKARREYRDDILQLSSTDISLLATYFINSNTESQKKFLELLHSIYNDKLAEDNFMVEFKNLYYLSKAGLSSTTQYGAAKRVIIDFLNKLKDDSMSEKKLDSIKEKELAGRLFIVKKLIKYFLATSGSMEIKNIDDFITMLDVLEVNDRFKSNALGVAIENNVKFYNNNLKRRKKSNDDLFGQVV